jgi:hypothetical protein
MIIKTINGNEGLSARGAVDIQIFEDGKLVGRIEENNLVVALGKQNIALLLGGMGGGAIAKVGVGTNGLAPTAADDALTNSFVKALTATVQPTPNQIQFQFEINNDEANGITIREFGLLTAAGVLCARKNRLEDIVKTNAIRLVGTWTITIN